LDFILKRLQKAGIRHLVVNTHYLAPQVVEHYKKWERHFETIAISHEEVILETGGAIRKALPLLGKNPFWVLNGDVIFDPDDSLTLFEQMAQAWSVLEKA
jgi:MurNAc alpha-1-phosphate uridylyltransferase